MLPTGGSNIHSGVGHLMLVHCGSRVFAFLVGLAGAKGCIHHWLHCGLGCRETNSVKIEYLSVTDLYNVKQDIAVKYCIGVHAPQDTCTQTVSL